MRSGERQSQGHTRARAEAPRVATKGQSRGAQREGIAAQFAERRRDRGSAAPAMTGRTDPRPSVEFEGATDERSTSTLREGGGTSPSAKENGARPADKGAQVKEVCGASVAWAHRLSAVDFEGATRRVVDLKTSTSWLLVCSITRGRPVYGAIHSATLWSGPERPIPTRPFSGPFHRQHVDFPPR